MNSKNRVYILTFHRAINYGAVLQAVATYSCLNNMNLDVKLVDYRHPRIESNRKLIGGRWSNKKSLFGNLKSIIKDVIDFPREYRRKKLYDTFVSEHTKITKKCSENTILNVTNDAEYLVVGSDLVWNWELDPKLNSVFFLDFSRNLDCYKISYASSVGSNYIPERLVDTYIRKLSKFDSISVRELSIKYVFENLLKREIQCVVDPTLQLDAKEWEKKEKKIDIPDEYVLLYILESTNEVCKIVKKTIDYFKLPILYYSKKTISYLDSKSINYYSASPSEFLYIIHHSKYVVTNSFHGTAFSVIFDRPFVSIPHSTRGTRMVDFLDTIDMSSHCVSKVDDYDIVTCNKQMMYRNKELLQEWILDSRDYLEKNIK